MAFEHQEVQARRAGNEEAAAAWRAHKTAVEDAMWAGNNAALDYLQQRAGYSRVGHHGGGAGRWIDAHGWTVASFFQHTSRTNDPHLHIHNAVLWRVQGTDRQWRTPDSEAITAHRPAAAAIAERTTTEYLSRTLGVLAAMRPDGKSREIVGVDQAINDLFSARDRAITPKKAELIRAFEAQFGRSPDPGNRMTGRHSSSGSTAGSSNYAPRSKSAWTRWPIACWKWASKPNPWRRRSARKRSCRSQSPTCKHARPRGRRPTSPARSTTPYPTTSAASMARTCRTWSRA
jgi:TrwC relaxase